jgi:hypothetical protein
MVVDKNDYISIKSEVLEFGKSLCSNEELDSFSNHLDSKLNDFRPTLMIYGAYNAGKSTLLNALFGKEEYAKTGDAPETKDIHEYEYNGYTIYDTPGLNARGEDDIVTTEHLKKSEIVLFVISNNGSLEEEFVYNKISEVVNEKKPLIIVLNNKSGIDENSLESREVIDKVSINLSKIGDRNGIENIESKVNICVVNAKSALKAKLENKQIMLRKSNIIFLEEMIDNYFNISGQKEVINALNIYINHFVENLILKIDSKIDIIELKKVEELILYLDKLKKSSDIRIKNIVDKKVFSIVEDITSQILNGNCSEKSLKEYIEDSISDINNQVMQVVNKINMDLSTKIDEFSKEFEELHIDTINYKTSNNDNNDDNESIISDEMKSRIKETITNKKVTEEATKQILNLAKKYLPKKIMFGKGPAWIGKIAGKAAVVASVAVEAYNIYGAYSEHNKAKEAERTRIISAKNDAQRIANDIKTALYLEIDEIINDIFNSLIINFKNQSFEIYGTNKELMNMKNKFLTVLNKL